MLDNFKRPSKALAEALVANNRTPVRTLPGAIPMEGGLPIVVNENVIGAIGVSGVTAQQDGQMAQAGVDALPQILGPEARGAPQTLDSGALAPCRRDRRWPEGHGGDRREARLQPVWTGPVPARRVRR
jgi:hypothetical protein